MNVKILIQLLLFIILASTAVTYYNFYKDNKTNTDVNEMSNDNEISIDKSVSNLITNISYSSTDNLGNEFMIKSKIGKISIDNPNVVYMTNVNAIINLINSDKVMINSKYAKYNRINYETSFEKDVFLTFQAHRITSQNLDLSFEKNLATIYNKIEYDNNNLKLNADILEIDLIKKDTRIFMNNEYKKIKVTNYK